MIKITHEQHNLVVKITASDPIPSIQTTLVFPLNDGAFAILLSENLNKSLHNAIAAVRAEAYQQGWVDHRSKKPRAEKFTGDFVQQVQQ